MAFPGRPFTCMAALLYIPSMKWKIEPNSFYIISQKQMVMVGNQNARLFIYGQSCSINIYSIRLLLNSSLEVMHYYPMFPLSPPYLYPAINPHLHAELTAIHHGHLMRQQAELEYLSRTNLQLNLERASRYDNQVMEKELRIARMMEEDRTRMLLERQIMEERSINEELRFKEEMRKLDLQRQYLLSREARPYLTQRKKDLQNESMRQTLKNPANALTEVNKQTAKFNTVQHGGEILNFKPKNYYVPLPNHQKQPKTDTNNYTSYRKQGVQSLVKDITYRQNDGKNLQDSNKKRRSSILKSSQKKSPKLAKDKKQVQFAKDTKRKERSYSASFQDHQNESYCLNNSALRAAYSTARKNPQIPASKKIENRLKVSAVVYRDSQFRNLKHEVNHLANTYDTQCRLRKQLKGKINGRDQIIRKYNIVPVQPK